MVFKWLALIFVDLVEILMNNFVQDGIKLLHYIHLLEIIMITIQLANNLMLLVMLF